MLYISSTRERIRAFNAVLDLLDQNAAVAHTYTVTDAVITREDGIQINYTLMRQVTLNAGNSGNTVIIQSTDVNTQTVINSGDGNDTINVQATGQGSLTVITAGAGNDALNVGNAANTVNDIAGALDVVGGAGADTLTINDQGTTLAQTYTIQNTVIRRGAAGFAVTYGSIATLTLNGGSGGNTINVQSTASGTATQVNAGAGDDIITVASGAPNPNRLDDIQGSLMIDGQGGNNQITIDDSGNQGPRAYRITNASVSRAGIATITTMNYTRRTVRGAAISQGPVTGNVFNVISNLANTSLSLSAGGGNDMVILGSDANTLDDLHGTIAVSGSGGSNTLQLNDQGDETGDTYTVANGTVAVARLSDLQIAFDAAFGQLGLATGPGDDTFNLNSPTPGLALSVDAGSGYDRVIMASGAVTDPQLRNIEALQITGGTLSLNANLNVQDFTESGGTLTGSGILTATSTASWTGGTMSGAGATAIAGAAVLTVSGAETLDTRTLANSGTATWNDGSIDGTTGTVHNSGRLSGTGSLTDQLVDDGNLYPGGDGTVGAMTVTGDYTESGTLHIDLLSPGASDQLTVSGSVTLGGSLDLTPLAGFTGSITARPRSPRRVYPRATTRLSPCTTVPSITIQAPQVP